MKRIFTLLAVIAVFAACQKEQVAGSAGSARETVTVSFSAALSNSAATKASFDEDGTGTDADQCKLQILWKGNVFYETTVEVVDFEASFDNIVLVKDQTYDFLFWADNAAGAYYDTEDLTAVALNGEYVGNNDKRDAFYAALTDQTITEAFSKNVTLHRPFAQLNVIATDIPLLKAQINDDELFAAVVPDEVSLGVTVPTVFNVKSGEASSPAEISYCTSVYTSPYKTESGDKNTLSMDYFFAPDSENNVVDVTFSAKNSTSDMTDIDYTFQSIPLRRNWRTNVMGALITVQGSVSVVIDPEWTDEIDSDPFAETE